MSDKDKGNKGSPGNKGNNRFKGNNSGKKPFKSNFKKGNQNNAQNKPKRKGECADLTDYVYFIGDARQADNYTKVTEAILNYIQRTYQGGTYVKEALESGKDYDFTPERPTPIAATSAPTRRLSTASEEKDDDPSALSVSRTDTTSIEYMILSAEIKQYVDKLSKYIDNMHKAYALILGQCTLGLKGKLEGRTDWALVKSPIKLLQAIKETTHNYQDSRYPIASIFRSLKTFVNIKQEEKEPAADFVKRF